MKTFSVHSFGFAGVLGLLFAVATGQLLGQTSGTDATAAVEGRVHDSQDHPVAEAVISLEGTIPSRTMVTASDSQGHFRFASVPTGSYTVRAKLPNYEDCTEGPFVLHEHETKSVALLLTKEAMLAPGKDSASAIAFSDEPAFTVAGVTDTTALGGHGSGPVTRNSNVLSKETASLAKEGAGQPGDSSHEPAQNGPAQEAAIRAMLAREDSADLRMQLAEIEEKEGRPLEAVQDYQRAAEMQPTEAHLFAWGAELLLHHAPEPAIEVFTKGHRLYPQSARMMLGLGAAWYAQRSTEQAEQIFLQACDLNPSDPTPYLFLGRVQLTEKIAPPGLTERMKRFVRLHPESAMAHYLYAEALSKQDGSPENDRVAETELKTAIQIDPHFGNAYLQLGILLSTRQDYPGAIAALEKAIELTPLPDEAHYHLAQVYRRTGEPEKAHKEIELFKQLSEQKNAQAERERHEIQQFVYTLREQNPASPPGPPDSH